MKTPERKMKHIVASDFRLAHLAAEQLRLAPYEWRLANRVEDLQGVTAENIVLVFPVLGPNSPYRDACEYAHHIAARDGVKLKTVTA
jgi:hypothetical protein